MSLGLSGEVTIDGSSPSSNARLKGYLLSLENIFNIHIYLFMALFNICKWHKIANYIVKLCVIYLHPRHRTYDVSS